MKKMKICIYGAASDTIDPYFIEQGEELGRLMAGYGHTLVFGGGSTGMMGACARGIAEGNGDLIGVIPDFMKDYETLYEHCTNRIKTHTMSGRKELMEKLADAFVIAPGGIGTMDEFFQVLTLAYLDRKKAPIVIFNIKGYYDSLLEFIEQGVQKGTIHERSKDLFVVRDKPLDVLTAISSFDK
jgi:uncharacterized protein (TIGR00730 family)